MQRLKPSRKKSRLKINDLLKHSGRAAPGTPPVPKGQDPAQQQDPGNPSREEVVTTWKEPVTNHEEQGKITNAGEGDIPLPDK